MPYPVSVTVQPALTNRNRLTTSFRLILAIPHLILVGGIGFGSAAGGNDGSTSAGSDYGLLGAVAVFLAIVSWFTIVAAGTHIIGIRQFTKFYMRWRVRALAYFMLLEDAYPPFGDVPYPASIDIVDPAGPRERLTVALRLLLAVPHFWCWCWCCWRGAWRPWRPGSSSSSRARIRRACTSLASARSGGGCGSRPTCCCWSTSTRPSRSPETNGGGRRQRIHTEKRRNGEQSTVGAATSPHSGQRGDVRERYSQQFETSPCSVSSVEPLAP